MAEKHSWIKVLNPLYEALDTNTSMSAFHRTLIKKLKESAQQELQKYTNSPDPSRFFLSNREVLGYSITILSVLAAGAGLSSAGEEFSGAWSEVFSEAASRSIFHITAAMGIFIAHLDFSQMFLSDKGIFPVNSAPYYWRDVEKVAFDKDIGQKAYLYRIHLNNKKGIDKVQTLQLHRKYVDTFAKAIAQAAADAKAPCKVVKGSEVLYDGCASTQTIQ